MNQDQSSNFYSGPNPQQGSGNGYPYPSAGYAYPQGGAGQVPYPQQGGYQPPEQGYSAPQAGYAQNPYYGGVPQTGYNSAGEAPNPYPQQGYTAFSGVPANGYSAGQGYSAGGYGQQPGSYIPQTPNYTQGYTAQGYAPYPGYQTAQGSPYGQMGREPEKTSGMMGQVPMNGGGYVPQAVPLRKQPFALKDLHLILGGAVLLGLFAAGMFIPGLSALKWVFLALAAGCIALLWIRPLTEANKKICFTAVFALLCVVALISSLNLGGGTADRQNPGTGGNGAAVQPTMNPDPGSQDAGSRQVTAAPATNTPEPDNNSAVTNRLYQFFQYWSANQTDEMLTLCSPTWQSRTDNAKADLFGLLANRTPLDYNFENISGTANDQSRTVTLNTLMDRNNGKDPSRYRLNVIMVKESEQWYVDPQSLQTYEAADTPDPNVTATPSPTPEMKAEPNTVLYYNPDGGTKYHLDQNCKSTHKKYLPLKGHFNYSEINKDPYSKLSPCNVCGAPLR